MNLTILVPSEQFAHWVDITHLVAETARGSWGIWPHRQDCVGVLVPGILTFQGANEDVQYVAIDVGVLVKTGPDVRVSVRRAMLGTELARLRDTVEREYEVLTQTEREVRQISEKLEVGFLRRMVALHHE